jgi:methyl coenzyme M reductase subunit D
MGKIRVSIDEEVLKDLEEILKNSKPIMYETYVRDKARKNKKIVEYFLRFIVKNYKSIEMFEKYKKDIEDCIKNKK